MKHVFIATPTHSPQLPVEYVKSLLDTIPVLLHNDISYTHSMIVGNALIHDARNQLVGSFLKSPATDLLFIDSDMGWNPYEAVALIKTEQDVVGGVYRQKRDDCEMYNVADVAPTDGGLLECRYIGAGFLKITRAAIEKMYEAYADLAYQSRDGGRIIGLFEAPIRNGKLTGEDAMFAERWRALGERIYVAPNLTLEHIGTKAYRGNFADMAARESKKVA